MNIVERPGLIAIQYDKYYVYANCPIEISQPQKKFLINELQKWAEVVGCIDLAVIRPMKEIDAPFN